MSKAADAFRTISEVADDLEIPKHVLRFWELKFPQVKPMKRGGGRRYYRPEDVELLRGIHGLLHGEGYTIKGVQKILRSQGVEHVKARAQQPAQVAARPAASAAAGAGRGAPPAAGRAGRAAGAAGGGAAGDAGDWRSAVAAVVRELEACRMILTGPSRAAKPARRTASRE